MTEGRQGGRSVLVRIPEDPARYWASNSTQTGICRLWQREIGPEVER